jgi:lipid-binding SYLF domain-containing protein
VGREASAQTDAALHAEMLSYSRSRGVFGGLTLEGATLRPDRDANKELYGSDLDNKAILQGDVKTPAAAEKLEQLLDKNSSRRTN